MDNDIAKQSQKILAKQGMKFKLNTKVLGGDASGSGVSLKVEAAKGGKEETVRYLLDTSLQFLLTGCVDRRRRCSRRNWTSSVHQGPWI